MGRDEMREILSDWCQLSDNFHEMSSEEALRLLIKIFKEKPVSLKPLASRLEKSFLSGGISLLLGSMYFLSWLAEN